MESVSDHRFKEQATNDNNPSVNTSAIRSVGFPHSSSGFTSKQVRTVATIVKSECIAKWRPGQTLRMQVSQSSTETEGDNYRRPKPNAARGSGTLGFGFSPSEVSINQRHGLNVNGSGYSSGSCKTPLYFI
jgi:hypothetical protein